MNAITPHLEAFLEQIGETEEYKSNEIDQKFLDDRKQLARRIGGEALRQFHILSQYVKSRNLKRSARKISALDVTYENPNAQIKQGITLLHLACMCGDLELVNALISAGANPNAHDKSGNTPLHMAIKFATTEAVKALLKAGADPNAQDRSGQSLLHLACVSGEIETTAALLTAGADPNVQDPSAETPLFKTCIYGRSKIAKLLIAAGAGPTILNNYDMFPIHQASKQGHAETVGVLMRAGVDPNTFDKFGYPPLHIACVYGGIGVIKSIIRAGANLMIRNSTGKSFFDEIKISKTIDVNGFEAIGNAIIQQNFSLDRLQKNILLLADQIKDTEIFLHTFSNLFHVEEIAEDRGDILKSLRETSKIKEEHFQELIQLMKGETSLNDENRKRIFSNILLLDMPIFNELLDENVDEVKEIEPKFKSEERIFNFGYLKEAKYNSDRKDVAHLQIRNPNIIHQDTPPLDADNEVKENGLLEVPVHRVVLALSCRKEEIQQALKEEGPINLTNMVPKRLQKQELFDALLHLLYHANLPTDMRYLTKDLLDLGKRMGLNQPFISYLRLISALEAKEE
ncbi:MAG: ankyrin repeat domain-containing protein [Waddliaceae bacterium]